MQVNYGANLGFAVTPKDVFPLRAGQNSFRVLLVQTCINTASFAQTGRWSRMDSIPFTRSKFRVSPPFARQDDRPVKANPWPSEARVPFVIARSARQLPAGLELELTAVLLGFSRSDVPILTDEGLLKPLGQACAQRAKVLRKDSNRRFCQEVEWLSQATCCTSQDSKRR